jgi:Non-ribosomal peptide synthetase modules and related proteins
MIEQPTRPEYQLPPEQQAIRDKCFHPSGRFVEFLKEDVDQSIPERFAMIVRKYSDRLAVKATNTTLTYEQLDDQANRIAHSILDAVGEGNQPVAILMKHGASIIAAILGALKAGKIYVPLDPSYPIERLRYILRDAQPEMILTQPETSALAGLISGGKLPAIDVEEVSVRVVHADVRVTVPPEAYACILYTSGSTGLPKGVVDSHRTVLHGTLRITNPQHICAEDRLSLTHSCSTSGSLRRIFPALLNGAALFPLDVTQDGLQRLAQLLNEESITIFGSARIRDVLRTIDRSQLFPSLRLVSCGGEVIHRRDVGLFRQIFGPHCVLQILMSSTEAGNITQFFIDNETEFAGDIIPAGYPAEDIEVIVLDETGQKVGKGEIGELTVRSRYLSCGYWLRSELTDKKFRSDSDDVDVQIYRTGDVGRLALDGCVFHLGRRDDQVKVRGYRVEMAEIEAALLNLGAFSKVFVTSRDRQSDDNALVGYLVPESWPAPTMSALRKALASALPGHMIPSVFVMLKALPLTLTGKVDRSALPAPGNDRPELDTDFVPPRSPVEVELARIWREVLSLDQVGTRDNFFDLGGHSLTATQIISRVTQTFGAELPVKVLFDYPTVAEMAVIIEQGQGRRAATEQMECIVAGLEAISEDEAERRLGGSGTR